MSALCSGHVRIRIHSIDVVFESPTEYPIDLKVLLDGRLLFNLKANSGNVHHWTNIHPIDAGQNGLIEIRVYELHWLGKRRERVGAINFRVREMVGAASNITARNAFGTQPFSVSLSLEPANSSRNAAKNAQNAANTIINMSPSVLESMGRTRDAVETILKVGKHLAELSPIAKAVVGVCSQAWETLKEQDQCDTLVTKLVLEMGDVLEHVAAVEHHAKIPKLQATVKELLLLVEDASRFVVEYKSDGAAVRALNAFVSSNAQGQVDEFMNRFGTLKENFDRGMVTQVVHGVETLLNDADQTLLKTLIVPGASHDPKRSCLEGTRVEVLELVKNWALATAGSPTFFWLHGPAGCGKSAVATSVSESLRRAGVLAGSFFCKRDSEHLRKPENVISHLAVSLAFKCPAYGAKLVEILRPDPLLAYSATGTRFTDLIFNPLQSIDQDHQFSTLVVIVDAIDESGTVDDQVELARCLLEMSKLVGWLRVLVTSRPNDEIRPLLGLGQEGTRQCDLFAEDEASVSRDILAYIRSRMNAMPPEKTGRSQWKNDANIHRLSAGANGLFIWARTACSLIQRSLDPNATLEQILAGGQHKGARKALGDLYTTALKEGLDETNDDPSIIQLCVGAIILTGSRRPLRDEVLATMLSGRVQLDTLSRLIDRLGSVLYRDDSHAVRAAHQSFSDYMTGEDCRKEYRIDLLAQNAELAASCLQIMLRSLRFNICGLEDSCLMNSEVPDLQSRIERNIRPELLYSCMYWATHLTVPAFASISSLTVGLLDKILFGKHLLYWIEVLSLSDELHIIMTSMDQLINWIDDNESKYTTAAVDVYRFLSSAYAPISSSTPHLYVSALAFGAANYATIQTLKEYFSNALAITRGMNLWKVPCIRTIPTAQPLLSVSVSRDGRTIVSGSDDGTLYIWDAHTGAVLLDPLPTHSDLGNPNTSATNRRHAASSSDRTTERESDEVMRCRITSVAFSSDSRWIVSGSTDSTVRVWDVKTGKEVLKLQSGARSVSTVSVVFSPEGRRIAASSDNTVRVWDVHTGQELFKPMKGHSDSVESVAFSSDGRRIVSSSKDHTVRAWDAQTGSPLHEPLFAHSPLTSVALTSDGRYIASGSKAGTVHIWDARTRVAFHEPLRGHSQSITSIAFSSDGRRIASGSADYTVRVWDVQTGKELFKPLQGHTGPVTSVAFSSDGRRIISSSEDKTVRIWDVQEGPALLQPLPGHARPVTSTLFSSDGQRIISGSYDD
ncbi:hypothetical protein FS749_001135, partial [Ceratobasidium sp. UAMH 11750]